MSVRVRSSDRISSDGLKGLLEYRGYDIGDLVSKKRFVDVQYLLIRGELPSPNQTVLWQQQLAAVPRPHGSVFDVIRSFP